jgi:hypothetical protein
MVHQTPRQALAAQPDLAWAQSRSLAVMAALARPVQAPAVPAADLRAETPATGLPEMSRALAHELAAVAVVVLVVLARPVQRRPEAQAVTAVWTIPDQQAARAARRALERAAALVALRQMALVAVAVAATLDRAQVALAVQARRAPNIPPQDLAAAAVAAAAVQARVALAVLVVCTAAVAAQVGKLRTADLALKARSSSSTIQATSF